MKTIWLVMSGEYSDLAVHAACLDEATAVATAERMSRLQGWGEGWAWTKEVKLLSAPEDMKAWPVASVTLVEGEDDIRGHQQYVSWEDPDYGTDVRPAGSRYTGAEAVVHASAPDLQRAVKIARDALAKHLAERAEL